MVEKCEKDKEIIDFIMPHTALHYIVDGYGYFNGKKLGAGNFFCAVENEKACYYPDKNDPWTYIFFDLKGDDIKDVVKAYKFSCENSCGEFTGLDNVKSILKLYNDFVKSGNDEVIFKNSIANLLLSLHCDKHEEVISAAEINAQKIKDYLDLNYNKKINMQSVASEFYLSRAYVRNIFFKKFGLSPKQYLQKVRMKRAAELLVDTNFSVYEIAISVGYNDQLAFSREFSKFYSVSPSNYRKQYVN